MTDAPQWNRNAGAAFGAAKPEDEFYHGWGPKGDSLTETWYWGFNVPHAAINCYLYCWTHPNLNVVTTGAIIYRGVKRQHLAAELFDIPAYLRLGPVVGDGRAIAAPNGLRVDVIEPLKHIRAAFDDPGRDTSFRVDMRAMGKPIMRANNLHFEQVMHCTGKLKLRGEDFDIDSYTVRDRSWGELRPETPVPSPPYNWATGVFSEGALAFNVGSLDDPARAPEWAGAMAVDPAHVFKDGWIAKGDEQLRILSASKRTRRNMETLAPEGFDMEIEDAAGERSTLRGAVVASVPWAGWPNMVCHLALVKWQWGGLTGYGESMDVQWNDYVYRFGQIKER